MIFRIQTTFAALICCVAVHAVSPQVVKLEPPQLSSQTISEEIVCTRPMREGKFNISLENYNGKTVVNCYGHGGSGWTTLFGSVNRAIKLFTTTNPPINTPIRVIAQDAWA